MASVFKSLKELAQEYGHELTNEQLKEMEKKFQEKCFSMTPDEFSNHCQLLSNNNAGKESSSEDSNFKP